jgi:hypothetical protein
VSNGELLPRCTRFGGSYVLEAESHDKPRRRIRTATTDKVLVSGFVPDNHMATWPTIMEDWDKIAFTYLLMLVLSDMPREGGCSNLSTSSSFPKPSLSFSNCSCHQPYDNEPCLGIPAWWNTILHNGYRPAKPITGYIKSSPSPADLH